MSDSALLFILLMAFLVALGGLMREVERLFNRGRK